MKLRIRDLAVLPTATLHDCEAVLDITPSRVITDSREVAAGDVFVAFRGTRVNAHDFVTEAFRCGAVACVVEKRWWRMHKETLEGQPLIVVADSMKAYGGIAKLHRAQFEIPLVAITGSNGKTSTKEMTAAVLRSRYRVLQTEGNFNNHIGLPATLLKLNSEHEVAVVEMGSNQPGDIAWLSEIARPSYGIITNIGNAHIQKLLSREGIAKEKTTLFAALQTDGTAVVNTDESLLSRAVPKGVHSISFGTDSRADIWLEDVRLDAEGRSTARIIAPCFLSRPLIVRLQSMGFFAALNAAAAIAVGLSFGCTASAIKKALESLPPMKGRLQLRRAGGITIIDDTYNANPDSVLAALTVLQSIRSKGRRCAVLGDMLELGEKTREEHERIGLAVAKAQVSYLFTYGRHSRSVLRVAREQASKSELPFFGKHFSDKNELHQNLNALLLEGDVVLIKGSRSMRMEETTEAVFRAFTNEEEHNTV